MVWEWRKQVMDGTVDRTFDFQPQLTSEPTAPEPYMEWKLKNAMISGYQMSHDAGAIDDLAVDPTNPHAGDDDNDDLSSGELAILLLPVCVQPDDGLLLPY